MNKEKPLVSIVIPVYNHKEWLKKALKSALDQTYKNIEVIVIDDGSEEAISDLEELRDSRVYYFRNENRGVAYSRNYGIFCAKGKYIAFLDSDDFWVQNKLEVQINYMEKKDAVWSQHCYFYYSDTKEKIIKKINTYKYRNNVPKIMFCSFQVQTSCFVVRKAEVIKYKIRFAEERKYGEDDLFYQEMIKKFPLLCIEEYLSYFRVKITNSGFNINKQIHNRAEIWKKRKNEEYFKKNTTFYVKFAYKLCVLIYEIPVNAKVLKSILYTFPYLIFKLETRRLCERY